MCNSEIRGPDPNTMENFSNFTKHSKNEQNKRKIFLYYTTARVLLSCIRTIYTQSNTYFALDKKKKILKNDDTSLNKRLLKVKKNLISTQDPNDTLLKF